MAAEVKCGGYLFRLPESLVERKNKQMTELPAEVGDDVTECEPSVSSNVRHDSGESDIRGGSGERSKHTGENRCKASLFLYLVQVFIYGVGNWK